MWPFRTWFVCFAAVEQTALRTWAAQNLARHFLGAVLNPPRSELGRWFSLNRVAHFCLAVMRNHADAQARGHNAAKNIFNEALRLLA